MCLFRFKAKITEPSPEYAQWLSKQKTAEDIINFANDFTYVYDKEQFGKRDYWQTPSEFFVNKKGDCEDVHLFIADVLHRALGLESYLIVAWTFTTFPLSVAHGMAIYKQNNQYYLVNYRKKFLMSSLRDKEALRKAGYNYIGGIWRMPNGKRVWFWSTGL